MDRTVTRPAPAHNYTTELLYAQYATRLACRSRSPPRQRPRCKHGGDKADSAEDTGHRSRSHRTRKIDHAEIDSGVPRTLLHHPKTHPHEGHRHRPVVKSGRPLVVMGHSPVSVGEQPEKNNRNARPHHARRHPVGSHGQTKHLIVVLAHCEERPPGGRFGSSEGKRMERNDIACQRQLAVQRRGALARSNVTADTDRAVARVLFFSALVRLADM